MKPQKLSETHRNALTYQKPTETLRNHIEEPLGLPLGALMQLQNPQHCSDTSGALNQEPSDTYRYRNLQETPGHLNTLQNYSDPSDPLGWIFRRTS